MASLDPGRYVDSLVTLMSHRLAAAFDALSHTLTALAGGIEQLLLAAPAPVVISALALLALAVRRWGVAFFSVLAFGLVSAMGLWPATISTLSLVLVASSVAILVGIPLGIWCSVSRPVSVLARPLLDFMQTLPAYVYLIPAVFFFGVGVVPAIVATAIFATPPAVRMTELGLRQVDAEMIEAAHAYGSPPWRILWEVQLPLAMPSLMAGVNQVIMLSLSMVVISGLVGAAGLGSLVVSAVTQLDVGAGFNSGLAVVILAVFLDRVTAGLGALHGRRRRRAT